MSLDKPSYGRVITSCSGIKDQHLKKYEAEQALRDSWDYFERRGYSHPEKINNRGIQPLTPEVKDK